MSDWPGIYERHAENLWRTAYRLLRSEADAADCVQEAFIRAWHLSRRQSVNNWGGLLCRLVTGKAIDCLRRRTRRWARETPLAPEHVVPDSPTPGDLAAHAELAEALRRALGRIPRRQAEAFVQSQFFGLSHAEIAAQLGLRDGHIAVLISRARKHLQKRLRPFCSENQPES